MRAACSIHYTTSEFVAYTALTPVVSLTASLWGIGSVCLSGERGRLLGGVLVEGKKGKREEGMCLQGEEEGSRERSKVMAFPVLSLGGGVFYYLRQRTCHKLKPVIPLGKSTVFFLGSIRDTTE